MKTLKLELSDKQITLLLQAIKKESINFENCEECQDEYEMIYYTILENLY